MSWSMEWTGAKCPRDSRTVACRWHVDVTNVTDDLEELSFSRLSKTVSRLALAVICGCLCEVADLQ